MVSALWKACSDGDLDTVNELLKEVTSVDIEVKDHTGVTPLIEAVKNGHVEVVRALLAKGADPANSSSQGPPEKYTSDSTILELLSYAQNKASSGLPSDEPTYGQDASQYEAPQPATYTYYPTINSAPPPPEGGVYYPQSPSQAAGENAAPGGIGNLPPPEIARFIPCRYFPACRYGTSCLFAHPQQYYPGSVPPPAQYTAPYDPMNVQSYPPNYFPPPSFQPPSGVHPMTPMSPASGPHPGHGRSPSEVVVPVQSPYSQNSIPPPVPYGPLSPSAYSHAGQAPVPMMMSALPPLQHQGSLPPHTPSNMYSTAPTSGPPYVQHDGATAPYPVTQQGKPNVAPRELNGEGKPLIPQEGPGPNNHHPIPREGPGHHRRGGRRGSFNGRKPPCLFFPAGRCRNGDDCRYPHVLPDGNGNHSVPYFSGRGGARPRHSNGNGIAAVNEKLSGLSVRDDASTQQNGAGAEGSSRSQSTDPGRPRFNQGGKNGYPPNSRPDKRPPPPKQRVPNADDFPVLAGSITPPTRNPGSNGVLPNGNGQAGPTAAQVLQAPPPLRKDNSKESSTRGATPDPVKPAAPTAESNGVAPEVAPATTHDHSAVKLPASFASVAAPEMPKEIALSA
ncbi:putative ankyrin repeat [Lyophyllum shimeji]|uniref:Ankyrin repeat n=1 Tax=Lyophyllum shimeji TaxID=47721 RepID=A0A9P3PIA7_LYOSH|nr:putative ankyrin repeat [Lyophyllum shimeji]